MENSQKRTLEIYRKVSDPLLPYVELEVDVFLFSVLSGAWGDGTV
jgi:hypothetical protein